MVENNNDLSTGGKAKVLLVEDDKFISKAYIDGLGRAGYEVIWASNGDDALEKLKSFKPNVILLDLVMPIKNGFEVLEILKSDEGMKDIPVVVLSNLGQETDVKKAKELGAVDYLIKSNMSMAEIVEKVKSIIK